MHATLTEPSREIPITHSMDVVVCGGGPAGFAAAVSAARAGAKTMVIEQHGCLGGIWTSGLLAWVLDVYNKPGVMEEVTARADALGGRGYSTQGKPMQIYDIEILKHVLESLCVEAGVEIRYHTRIVSTRVTNGTLTHIFTESKSGREAIEAKMFIDATGDGDLGALAGCGFDIGHPETGDMQPGSLIGLISGINAKEIAGYFSSPHSRVWRDPYDKLRGEFEKVGISPSYQLPSLFRVRDDLFIYMANHEYGIDGRNAKDVTYATINARKELITMVQNWRKLGGPWSNVQLIATAEQIGIRESRRLHGLYTVTQDDLMNGARFEDGICPVTFGIDVHALKSKTHGAIEAKPCKSQPYDIPMRSLISKDVQGLLFAGRCISGDFIAHSSYRVSGNAVALGQAAGRLAAQSVLTHIPPAEVNPAFIRP